MAEGTPSPSRMNQFPNRIPVELRAIGAMLARANQLRGMQLLVETDRHGNTQAYVERQRP